MAQNYVEILVRSRDQGAKPEMDDLRVKLNDLAGKVAEARAIVDDTAAAAKLDDLQAKLLRLDRTTARPNINMEQAVRAESQLHGFETLFAKLGDDAEQGAVRADKALDDVGQKAQQTGQTAAAGLSPLLMGAFVAAASAGPGLLLAGTAAAVLGAGALITKGNAQLAGSYQQLGQDASQAVTDATAPLLPQLQGALNVLDQGIGQTGDQLKGMFAAVAPNAQDMAHGLLSLADNALPGIETGLKAIAPYSHEIATDLGELGSGISGLFSGLAGGAGGGMQGFSALVDMASHLLTDVGDITGSLSNGLGPALHDIDTVAVPVAGALTDVVQAIPPGMVRGAADAVAVLFAAFEVGKIAGVVQEGQTFLQFLGLAKTESAAAATEVEALGVAEEATAVKTGLASKAMAGLGGAAGVALGPLGAITAGAGMLGDALGKSGLFGLTGKVGGSLVGDVSQIVTVMQDAADGSGEARDQITALAQAVADAPFGIGAKTLGDMDTALAQLEASNPQQAADVFNRIKTALEGQGKSAGDVAAMFPRYTSATQGAAAATLQLAGANLQGAGAARQLFQALADQQNKLADTAQQHGLTTVAALGLDGAQSRLDSTLTGLITSFDLAKGSGSAYASVLGALNDTTNTLLGSEASFTIALDGVAKAAQANGTSLDVNNDKGAQNIQTFTGLADSAQKAAEAVYQNEVQTKGANIAFADANNKLAQEKQAFIDAADKAGFNKDQVKALADELFKLPQDIPINADVTPAINGLTGLLERIDSSSGTVQIYSTPGSPTGGKAYLPNAHGGIIGGIGAAATGGIHGSLTMIDEQGPEMVRLPSGSMVMSHPDTMRLAAQQAGGEHRVVLEFAPGGDSEFEQFMMQALRRWVRIRGGNTQAVFGH
jgi:hypothetical protein